VLDRALDALVQRLEQRRFAASARSRPTRRRHAANERYVPADVRRTVWQRDQGQCTFVGESGHRCPARTRLEFDHVDPVARGGRSTADGMRLLCRAHNQHEAERAFGSEFMHHKREEARRSRAAARAAAEAKARAEAEAKAQAAAEARAAAAKVQVAAAAKAAAAAERARQEEVIPWLRQLGFRGDELRRGAALSGTIPDAPLEERVRLALSGLAPRGVRRVEHIASRPA
jgi:5-methylcytosine-specific restriction endonuclease McrA